MMKQTQWLLLLLLTMHTRNNVRWQYFLVVSKEEEHCTAPGRSSQVSKENVTTLPCRKYNSAVKYCIIIRCCVCVCIHCAPFSMIIYDVCTWLNEWSMDRLVFLYQSKLQGILTSFSFMICTRRNQRKMHDIQTITKIHFVETSFTIVSSPCINA